MSTARALLSFLCVLLALASIACDASECPHADAPRACSDFYDLARECVADGGETLACTLSCDDVDVDGCIDAPSTWVERGWSDSLRDGCNRFAADWARECEAELGEGTFDALADACYRDYFDPSGVHLPDCAGAPEHEAREIETSCEA